MPALKQPYADAQAKINRLLTVAAAQNDAAGVRLAYRIDEGRPALWNEFLANIRGLDDFLEVQFKPGPVRQRKSKGI